MYETIVAGYHKSTTARDAVEHAVALSNHLSAQLHLVTSFDQHGAASERGDAERQLHSFELGSGHPVETHVLPGDIADAILQVAGQVDADLIVVGNKGLADSKRVTGSVAGAVSTGAPCDVLIAHTT